MIEDYVYADSILTPEECKQFDVCSSKIRDSLVEDGRPDKTRKSRSMFIPHDNDDLGVLHLIEKVVGAYLYICRNFYKFPIEFIEAVQYCEYGKGCFYQWHRDCAVQFDGPDRDISASVILSDAKEYKGGKLQFRDLVASPVTEKQGRIIVFPSLSTHQVTKVTSGNRKSLVLWGRRGLPGDKIAKVYGTGGQKQAE